ncbi:putative leader peptide [Streptomyces angustmyceticus]|uniref:putative leader peptide n=1 Tax=Streptomyces angustmyceticus TaxID=285578 RepID=UPI0034507A5B
MAGESESGTRAVALLTWLIFAASLRSVSHSENFTARLHVDLRRQASAICAISAADR